MVVLQADARNELIAGADLLARAVRTTLGPAGRSVILERTDGPPLTTRDGATVAANVAPLGALQKSGAALLRQAAARTKAEVGDGSTTATVLAHAMLRCGSRYMAVGVHPQVLCRGMQMGVKAALACLGRMAIPCTSARDLRPVALVAAHGDQELADLVARAVRQTGPDGLVRIEEGSSSESTVETISGFAFASRLLTAAHPTSDGTRLEHCRILIHDGNLDSVASLVPVLSRAAEAKAPLLLVADGVSSDVRALISSNVAHGNIKACVVSSAALGDGRQQVLQDLAAVAGTTVLSSLSNARLSDLEMEELGYASAVDIHLERTLLERPRSPPKRLEARIWELRHELLNSSRGNSKELQERIAQLRQAVAVLHIGANSDSALHGRTADAHDAVRAAQAAAREGTVPGGGIALLRCAQAVQQLRDTASGELLHGLDTVVEALAAPFQQILANAGIEPKPVQARVLGGTGAYGFDIAGQRYGDLQAFGVVDATVVTATALRNAASVATLLLSTDAVVSSEELL